MSHKLSKRRQDLIDVFREYVAIDKERQKKENFYNTSVDPFVLDAYKTIRPVADRENTFEQTVQSAGCVHREGYIRLLRDENIGSCQIQPKVDLIGC